MSISLNFIVPFAIESTGFLSLTSRTANSFALCRPIRFDSKLVDRRTYDGDEECAVGRGKVEGECVRRQEDNWDEVTELYEDTRRTDDEERTVAKQRNIQHLKQRRKWRCPGNT